MTKRDRINYLHNLFFAVLWFILLIIGTAQAQGTAKIKYISAGMVYIDQGKAAGIEIDDRVQVWRNGTPVAILRVRHVAPHSAACEVESQTTNLQVADEVRFTPHTKQAGAPEMLPKVRSSPSESQTRPELLPPPPPADQLNTTIRGRAEVGVEAFQDQSKFGEDFYQPQFRITYKVENLGGMPLHFRLKARSRYQMRRRNISAAVRETEWRNRFYYAELSYQPSSYTLHFGRIYSDYMRGGGSWDGMEAVYHATGWGIGVLGGFQPDLTRSEPNPDQQKYGGYLYLDRGDYRSRKYKATVGVVGQYIQGEVSREVLYLQANYWEHHRLSVYQQAEVDLNRGWKANTGAGQLQLSRFNLSIRYQVHANMHISAAYTHSENVRQTENRDIPDSLFFNAQQQGFRGGGDWKLSPSLKTGTSIGWRVQTGQTKPAFSVSHYLRVNSLWDAQSILTVRYQYADNRFLKGHAPSVDLYRTFEWGSAGVTVRLEHYNQSHEMSRTLNQQELRWYGSYLWKPQNITLQGQYFYQTGDLRQGHHLWLSVGYRW